MSLLGVRVQVVQPRHPDVTDRTHVGLLACVNSLVDPELSLVIELLITEIALVQELPLVFVLAVLPLTAILVPGPADGADISGLIPGRNQFNKCYIGQSGALQRSEIDKKTLQ